MYNKKKHYNNNTCNAYCNTRLYYEFVFIFFHIFIVHHLPTMLNCHVGYLGPILVLGDDVIHLRINNNNVQFKSSGEFVILVTIYLFYFYHVLRLSMINH